MLKMKLEANSSKISYLHIHIERIWILLTPSYLIYLFYYLDNLLTNAIIYLSLGLTLSAFSLI